eukprot:5645396-Pyramimonas_sp.AAC.1
MREAPRRSCSGCRAERSKGRLKARPGRGRTWAAPPSFSSFTTWRTDFQITSILGQNTPPLGQNSRNALISLIEALRFTRIQGPRC